MPPIERRRTQDDEHVEIKQMIGEIKQMLIARQYIDEIVIKNNKKLDELENGNGKIGFKAVRDIAIDNNKKLYELENGNGEIGFKAVRDKVVAWGKTGTAITLLVTGDIVMRVIQLVSK